MARSDDELPYLPSPRGEVEAFFSEVLGRRLGPPASFALWNPRLDLIEESDRFIIEMDLPGVRPEDVRIGVEGRLLTVSGRREIVRESGGPHFRLRERSSGSFSRVVELPDAVDREGISSLLREGILRIDLPKRRPGR